jgi:hypothetical protein
MSDYFSIKSRKEQERSMIHPLKGVHHGEIPSASVLEG